MSYRLNPDYIHKCSYTDFVGLVNQTNVPPGSFNTVNEWTVNGFVKPNSHIVEIACTTGFSVREISRLTGCSGEGVDISENSIKSAILNASTEVKAGRLKFTQGDAITFSPQKKGTHVIIGAALGFFPNPELMLEQLTTFFADGKGLLLASPFYTTSDIPQPLINEARSVLGITPTTAKYKEVMAVYKNFQIRHESRRPLLQETEKEIHHYCRSTVERASHMLNDERSPIISALYNRLFEIRQVTNRLRLHQGYAVLVLGYDAFEYGKRFVEIF